MSKTFGGTVLGMKIRSLVFVYIKFVMQTRHQSGDAKQTNEEKKNISGTYKFGNQQQNNNFFKDM